MASSLTGSPATVPPGAGTPAYAAPEQLDGQPLGPSADVFALGVVIVEAHSGTRAPTATPPRSTSSGVRRLIAASVAPPGKLAAMQRPFAALAHDVAYRLGEIGAGHAVEDDMGDRALAVHVLQVEVLPGARLRRVPARHVGGLVPQHPGQLRIGLARLHKPRQRLRRNKEIGHQPNGLALHQGGRQHHLRRMGPAVKLSLKILTR